MTRFIKLALPFAVALAIASPAHAQFGGNDDQMTQFAPMLNMMKKKLGKKRFGMIMQTMGPMMANMMDNGGGGFSAGNFGGFSGGNFGGFSGGNVSGFPGGNFGDFSAGNMGGIMSMLGNGQNISGLMSMIGGFTGHGGHHARGARRRHAG